MNEQPSETAMSNADAADVLRRHNAWRRDIRSDQELVQVDACEVGRALDVAIARLAPRPQRPDTDEAALLLARKIVALHPECHPGGPTQYLAMVQVLIADALRAAAGTTKGQA